MFRVPALVYVLAAATAGIGACGRAASVREPVAAACDPRRVERVEIRGGTAADVPQLAVLEGTLHDAARAERIAAAQTEQLRLRGYAHARVAIAEGPATSAEPARGPGCGVTLAVEVARGPRFRIAALEIAATDDFPAARRLAEIEDGLGAINVVGGAYVEDRLVRALAVLQRRYREAGWLAATIDPPVAVYDLERGEVSVRVPIRAGARFKIGSVVARGGRRTTRTAIIEALGLRGGQWFDASALRAAIVRVRREIDEPVELRVQIANDRKVIDLEALVDHPAPSRKQRRTRRAREARR